MQAAKNKSNKTKKSTGGKVIQLNVFQKTIPMENPQLVNGLWNVAQGALWSNREFSVKEKEYLKTLLAEHFKGSKNPKRTFKELVERICLAKRYVARRRERYISKPQDWLNIHYPMGLAGTEAWLSSVQEMREQVPFYNEGISTLATGILKFIENPQGRAFQKYRKQLLEKRQFDLLQIFGNSIIHYQYTL